MKNQVQFIIKSARKGRRFDTFKFNTKEEGFDFLAKYNLDHRIIDIL